MKKIILTLLVISILLSLTSILININYHKYPSTSKSLIDQGLIKNNINYKEELNCSNQEFLTTAYCLRSYLIKFYNYNLSYNSTLMTLDELKTKGGVCSHYANWYKDNMINLGFDSVTFITTDYEHEFALAWSKDKRHTCILDQWSVVCT